MFVESEILHLKYRGMNPAFVQRVRKARDTRLQPLKVPRGQKRALSKAMKEEAEARLRDMPPPECPENMPEHRRIIRSVAYSYRVTEDDIMGPGRSTSVVLARRDAIARCYQEIRIKEKPPSLTALGRWFMKDHTAILHALYRSGLKGPKGQRGSNSVQS